MRVTDRKGSVTIESAITLPLFISVILLFSSLIICVIATNCVYSALYKCSGLLSDYAYLYHENGVKKVEDSFLRDLSRLTGDSNAVSILKLLNIRELSEGADNLVYSEICETMFSHYLKEDPVYRSGFIKFNSVSFAGSSFFDHGDDIVLIVRCKMKFPLPVLFKLTEGFEIQGKVRFRCWIGGDPPLYVSESDNTGSVWNLDNFERGMRIREAFGANLPFNYPVIARYENGKATMIKSLDHTSKTYQNNAAFSKAIINMIDELSEFNGRQYGSIIIRPVDIKSRELILVMPTNDMSPVQELTMVEVMHYSRIKNINLIVERYQEKK